MFLSNYLYWHVFLTHTAYYLYLLQVTSTLTFAAACASAGITVLIGNDLGICNQNHCLQFETSTAMAFLSWFTALPSFLLNFWSLASRWMTPQLGIPFHLWYLCFDLVCVFWYASQVGTWLRIYAMHIYLGWIRQKIFLKYFRVVNWRVYWTNCYHMLWFSDFIC